MNEISIQIALANIAALHRAGRHEEAAEQSRLLREALKNTQLEMPWRTTTNTSSASSTRPRTARRKS